MNLISTLKGILCLLIFYGLGETLSLLTAAPIPGAVIGMLLLFAVLRLSGRPTPQWLTDGSQFLIRLLSLFFLPAAVGLFFLPAEFHRQWPALLATIVMATLCSLALTALALNFWVKKNPARTVSEDRQ